MYNKQVSFVQQLYINNLEDNLVHLYYLDMFYAGSKLTDQNTIYFDIGANIGIFSFSMIRNGFDCYAFEPHPYYTKTLKLRKKLLQLEKIMKPWSKFGQLHIIEQPISDSQKNIDFFIHKFKSGSHSIKYNHVVQDGIDAIERVIKMTSISLDYYYFSILKLGSDKNVFIKIDVESAEWDVIRGAKSFIELIKPDLFIEVQTFGHDCSLKKISDYLLSIGYHLYAPPNLQAKFHNGKLISWVQNKHTDVLFSVKNLDSSKLLSLPRILSRKEKLARLVKNIFKFNLADLHHQSIRKPYDTTTNY